MVTSMKPVVFNKWRVSGPVVRSCMGANAAVADRPWQGWNATWITCARPDQVRIVTKTTRPPDSPRAVFVS
jgi:hypothetical protein